MLQVVLCSACSGHGYKFSTVIGVILADLATAGTTRHDIGLHRLSPSREGCAAFLAQCSRPRAEPGQGKPLPARL